MMRRLLADSIRNDPEWNNGNYTAQPRNMTRLLTYFSIATSNGNIALYNAAPTSAQGDALLAKRLAAPFRNDANDVLYQWESSADYDPSPGLEKIRATVLAINSTDDERNPVSLGMMESAMKRVKMGRLLLIPESAETRGHSTTGMAKFYKKELAELLEKTPKR
jgi:homoserine O-acetyltransferase